MAINSIFSFLMPKESKFFPLFVEVGEKLVKASDLLVEFIQTKDREKAKAIYLQIKAVETENDRLMDNMFNELNNTFITPFDREDIQALSEKLDDIIDFINSSSKRVVLFNPQEMPAKALEMAKIIQAGCQSLNLILLDLEKIKKNPHFALEQCAKIHDLEHQGDDVYEHYITELFDIERNGIELIKIKEIMQDLERTTDKVDTVGKIIKTIIVKYS